MNCQVIPINRHCIYFAIGGGLVKIGASSNVERRLYDLSRQVKHPLKLWHSYSCTEKICFFRTGDDKRGKCNIESIFHQIFNRWNLPERDGFTSEWFRLDIEGCRLLALLKKVPQETSGLSMKLYLRLIEEQSMTTRASRILLRSMVYKDMPRCKIPPIRGLDSNLDFPFGANLCNPVNE